MTKRQTWFSTAADIRKWLANGGFRVVSGGRVSVMGEYADANGNKVRVGYYLKGRTGQSAGSGAGWSYLLTEEVA